MVAWFLWLEEPVVAWFLEFEGREVAGSVWISLVNRSVEYLLFWTGRLNRPLGETLKLDFDKS